MARTLLIIQTIAGGRTPRKSQVELEDFGAVDEEQIREGPGPGDADPSGRRAPRSQPAQRQGDDRGRFCPCLYRCRQFHLGVDRHHQEHRQHRRPREHRPLHRGILRGAGGKRYLDTYPQIASVGITVHETKWSRLSFGGKPHPHSFVLDSNGKPTVEAVVTRAAAAARCHRHRRFCLHEVDAVGLGELSARTATPRCPPTADRMCATSMVASWKWSGEARELSRGQSEDSRHRAGSVRE